MLNRAIRSISAKSWVFFFPIRNYKIFWPGNWFPENHALWFRTGIENRRTWPTAALFPEIEASFKPPSFFFFFCLLIFFFLNDGRVNIFFLKKQTKKSVNKKVHRGNLQNNMESLFKVQGPSWAAGGLQVTAVATVSQTVERNSLVLQHEKTGAILSLRILRQYLNLIFSTPRYHTKVGNMRHSRERTPWEHPWVNIYTGTAAPILPIRRRTSLSAKVKAHTSAPKRFCKKYK